MYQQPRPAPRSASAASNPSTNPERTNNQREGGALPHRTRSSVDLASYTGAGGGEPSRAAAESSSNAPQDKENTRLNQIIQHFHTKAALTICSARAQLPRVRAKDGNVKQDRWFNIVLDDTDALLDELQEWKRSDLSSDRPPPLVIEVYIDTANLSQNQALVIADETGKRWDVADALAGSGQSSPRPTNRQGGKFCEVVLERWTIELGDWSQDTAAGRHEQLPNVYKKGVVLFRSLYTFLRFLPAWKLYRRLGRHPVNGGGGLRVKYRIKQGGLASRSPDSLLVPLYPLQHTARRPEQHDYDYTSDSDTQQHRDTTNGLERHRFESLACPSGPLRISVVHRHNSDFAVASAEALLSSRFFGRRESDPTTTTTMDPYNKAELGERAASANTKGKSPFKAGTLASLRPHRPSHDQGFNSRSPGDGTEPKPTEKTFMKTVDKQKSDIREIGTRQYKPFEKRISLNTLPQKALRAPPHSLPNETAIASSTSSPMAPPSLPRYQSSFAGRVKRNSSTSQGQNNTSEGSSARGSTSDQAASGPRSDDDDIQDFVGLLESDSVKFAKLTKPAPRRTVDLSVYSALREESEWLADDMSASSLLHKAPTPPSRRLSNVPALSTSSSPRPLGHATHVRSRLSTQSIAEGAGRGGDGSGDEGETEEPLLFRTDEV
ncbi:autophagy protein 13 [Elasticomyces elasticus]|uniref:Autophagy-related protein 13 n=1 Tax=Elasticomyces elasticus TaxID=574655 RepID=A0AAN7ZMM9_9PEZI|nr:autophagy protein 13 [Elasticomyces elasticus]